MTFRFRPKMHSVSEELREVQQFASMEEFLAFLNGTTTKWPERPSLIGSTDLTFSPAKIRPGELWRMPYEVSTKGRGLLGYTDGDPR